MTGSGGGAVTAYVAGPEKNGTLPWVNVGTRTGDGTIVASVNAGWYLAYVDTTSGRSTAYAVIATTGPYTGVKTQVRAAIKATILSLNLGLRGGVKEDIRPYEADKFFPCVILTHEGLVDTREQPIVIMDDVGHATAVLICDRVDWKQRDKMPQYDVWRQRIARAFSGQRLLGVVPSLICTVEDDVYTDQTYALAYQFMVSKLTIRCQTREPVGVGR